MPMDPRNANQRARKQARREDWRARADEMRAQFRSENAPGTQTQYYVGDPAPEDPTNMHRGQAHNPRQLQAKLDARLAQRNYDFWKYVQDQNDMFRPGDPNAPGGPDITNANDPDPGYRPPAGPDDTIVPGTPPPLPPGYTNGGAPAGPYGTSDPYVGQSAIPSPFDPKQYMGRQRRRQGRRT